MQVGLLYLNDVRIYYLVLFVSLEQCYYKLQQLNQYSVFSYKIANATLEIISVAYLKG